MKSFRCLLDILLVVMIMLASMTSCVSYAKEELEPTYWPTQDWINALPEELGLDSAQLGRMFEYINDNDIPLRICLTADLMASLMGKP